MSRDGIAWAGVTETGFIAILQMDSTRGVPGIELAAVYNPAPERLKETKKAYGIGRGHADWRNVMADKDTRIIHNCTPNHLHDKINRVAILTGKHIYMEEPLGLGAARAKSLWQLAMERGVAHRVNRQYQLSGAIREMRARAMEGKGRRSLHVNGCYLQDSAVRHTDYISRQMSETSPVKALTDIGVHWANTVTYVTGQLTQTVYTQIYTHYPLRLDTTTGREVEINSDDTTFVMARFEDGTPGTAVLPKCVVGHKNDLAITASGEQREYTQRQQSGSRLYIGDRGRGNEELLTDSNLVREVALPYVTMPVGHAMGWPDVLMHAIKSFYQPIRTEQYLASQVPMPLPMTAGGAMPSPKPM